MIKATLNEPFQGYRNIEVIARFGIKWLVRICESGLEIEIYDDEFVLDGGHSLNDLEQFN